MSEVRRDQWGRYLVLPPGGSKPVGYTRATTVAGWTDDKQSLVDWKATAAVVGLHRSPSLAAQWRNLIAKHADPWYASPDTKKACKQLVEESAKAGGSQDRADIGTLLHTLFELTTKKRGLPIIDEAAQASVDAWQACVATLGIVVDPAYVEQLVVVDRHKVAGTADMLRITVPGLGDVIADWKTGENLEFSWRSITTQLTIYSLADNTYRQGDAADGSQDVRGPMPDISRQHAVVFHLPAGRGDCTPYVVHLDPAAVDLAFNVNDWRRRKDLAVTLNTFLGTPSPVPTAALSVAPPPFDGPTPAVVQVPETRGEQLAEVPDRTPDEGGDAHPLEVDTWRDSYERIRTSDPAAASWIRDLAAEAQQHGVSFHLGGDAAKTDRRVAILAGLVRLAKHDSNDTETLRALLEATVGAKWPRYDNVPAGRAVGLLNATQASTFADLALDFVEGRLPMFVDDDEHVRFAPAA